MDAFDKATATFTAANVGSSNYKQIKKILLITMILTVASGLLISGIIYLDSNLFLRLYTNSSDVVHYGMYRLAFVTLLLPIQGIADTFIGSSRGMGYSSVPTLLMLVGICGVRLVWLFTAFSAVRKLEVLYACFPISWVITGVVEGVVWVYSYRRFMKENQE